MPRSQLPAPLIIQGLLKHTSGKYNRVRLLDLKPYTQRVYAFQREMQEQGITVDKRLTSNGAALDIALEGADEFVYFTHDYLSMTPDKNDFLVGTSKLARKHGVKSMVAVCPVEHDMAYTEDVKRSWVQVRQDAEQTALDCHQGLSILNTDLVFSDRPTHMLHYIAQCVEKGKIARPFL